VSVLLPVSVLKKWYYFSPRSVRILTWGGLRGGLSIAMALSLPESVPYRGIILLMTYAIVVFSILVQGMTIGKVAGHRTTHGNEYNDPRLDESREEKALPSVIERFLSRASRDTANKK
jgi:Na(+)/H(+) antiporter nhaP